MSFGEWLKSKSACEEGYKAHAHQTEQEFWDTCERGDWMLWVAERKYGEAGWHDHIAFVRIAAICARRSIQYFRDKDRDVLLLAIKAAEAFAENPTKENANAAAYAAANASRAAFNATYAAANAAGYAAGYAANAAYSAANAAANAAYAANDSAANATYAAAYVAAYDSANAVYAAAYDSANAAYAAEKKWQADEIRKIWPKVGA